MKYMMFVETDPAADPYDAAFDNVEDWVDRNDAAGTRVIGERLRPAADSKTVRIRKGELLVTDGPYAESHEWIAGFDILECADLDAAIAIAADHPMARFGRLQVWPFWSDDAPA